MRVRLYALRKCGPHKAGATFSVSRTMARALVALKRARYAEDDADAETPAVIPQPAAELVEPAEPIEPISGATEEKADDLLISDKIIAFAEENDVNYKELVGSGVDGRILKRDIQAIIDARSFE